MFAIRAQIGVRKTPNPTRIATNRHAIQRRSRFSRWFSNINSWTAFSRFFLILTFRSGTWYWQKIYCANFSTLETSYKYSRHNHDTANIFGAILFYGAPGASVQMYCRSGNLMSTRPSEGYVPHYTATYNWKWPYLRSKNLTVCSSMHRFALGGIFIPFSRTDNDTVETSVVLEYK